MEGISEKGLVSQIYIENAHFSLSKIPYFPFQFSDENKSSKQKWWRDISCSEFHQLSVRLIHFCCMSLFMCEKCWQSEIIKKHCFKHIFSDWYTFSLLFTHKKKPTVKIKYSTRKLVKFWFRNIPWTFLNTHLIEIWKWIESLPSKSAF